MVTPDEHLEGIRQMHRWDRHIDPLPTESEYVVFIEKIREYRRNRDSKFFAIFLIALILLIGSCVVLKICS